MQFFQRYTVQAIKIKSRTILLYVKPIVIINYSELKQIKYL